MSSASNIKTQIDLSNILSPSDTRGRKTKIVCTLGPACWSTEMLLQMIDNGMNVARLNFSHGDHDAHGNTLDNLRAALAERPDKLVAVMLDTKGPEIRTGFLEPAHKPLNLTKGQDLELITDYSVLGNPEQLAVSYAAIVNTVKPGSTIMAADGNLVMTVKEVRDSSVLVRVENSCALGERKNMNLPGAIVDLPTLTDKDEDDVVNFGLVQGVDMIAASFVRKASDVEYIREVLGPRGRSVKIISKIENQEGLQNFDEILEASDGIMVARGDLGMEIPPEKVFLAQKMMIRKCNVAGKPVITATQMLESMIVNPRPTRAECTDVANAVLDGTDCVMLSGESANGEYPVQAVQMMARVCAQAETAVDYNGLYGALRTATLEGGSMTTQEAIASSAVKTAIDMGAKMVVVLTETGRTARLVAKYRPQMPVLVVTALPETARQSQGLLKGCDVLSMGSMIGTDAILARAAVRGKEWGWVQAGDPMVCIHGMKEATSGGTNMLKVIMIN